MQFPQKVKNSVETTWIYLSPWTDEFIDSVEPFSDFTFSKSSSRGNIACPCKKYNYVLWQLHESA